MFPRRLPRIRPRAPRAATVVRTCAGAALAMGLAGCVVRVDSDGYRQREEKRFTTTGRPTVQLATFDGAIEIRGWDRDEVSVEIEKRARDKEAIETIDVIATQTDGKVSLEARTRGDAEKGSYQIGFLNSLSRSARLVASVPTGSDLLVRTGDGSIRVEHVKGTIELRSSDGSVRGFDLAGDIVAHTDDGRIELEGVDGRCDLTTNDGSITVQGRLEALRVRTDDGGVVVKALAGSRISRDWSLTTRDGSLVVYVPESFGADVDAETRDGSVRYDDALAFARADRRRERNILRGRLGDGGARLVMRTGDGSIRLRHLPGGVPPPPPPPAPPAPPPPSDVPVERGSR